MPAVAQHRRDALCFEHEADDAAARYQNDQKQTFTRLQAKWHASGILASCKGTREEFSSGVWLSGFSPHVPVGQAGGRRGPGELYKRRCDARKASFSVANRVQALVQEFIKVRICSWCEAAALIRIFIRALEPHSDIRTTGPLVQKFSKVNSSVASAASARCVRMCD